MDWQKQARTHAALQPMDERDQRFHQSAVVLGQRHSSSSSSTTGSRGTAAAGPGLGPPAAAASVVGATPYLYPPEWQQQGRPQQSPQQPSVWRQQQHMWQQQLQQQQGPPTQQTTAARTSPRTSVSAHPPEQQWHPRGSNHSGNSRHSLYNSSDLHTSSTGFVGDRDGYVSSSRYGGTGTSYTGAAASSYGSRSYRSSSGSSAYDGVGSWQQQQQLLAIEQEQEERSAVQEVEEQCIQSLQSSLRVAAETNEISQKTAVKLDEQSEQLREIRDTTAEIRENLQTSDYLLKGMKSWWGAFAQLFTSPPATKPKAAPEKASAAEATAASRSQSRSKPRHPSEEARSGVASTFAGSRGHCDWTTAAAGQQQQQLMTRGAASQSRVGPVSSDFDVRLEQDLQKLSEMLGEMHERAVAINSNLKKQNGMLNEIENNMDANQSSIAQQKKVLKEIMRK